jgi:amino acid transporter
VTGLELLALGINGIVGVGIFYAPADVARGAAGLASVLVFAVTGLVLVPVALCFAVLGRRFDADGGPVLYARAAFGERTAFLVGWVAYVSAVTSTAAVMSGLAASVAPGLGLTGPIPERLSAAALAVTLALVCAAGIAISARTWTALTVLKLVPLLALIGVFLLSGSVHPAVAAAPGHGGLLRAALTAAFAYQGFEIVPVIAGQVRSPARTVPLATAASLGVSALLYVALQAACVLALPGLASSPAPLEEAAAVWGGAGLVTLVRAGSRLSALGICLGMMVVTPRYLSTLAQARALGPGLDSVSPRGVPRRALAVTAVLVSGLVLAARRDELFVLSSLAVQVQYVATAAALATLARSGRHGLSRREAALAVPAGVVGLALAAGATPLEWLVTAGMVALGLLLRAARKARAE